MLTNLFDIWADLVHRRKESPDPSDSFFPLLPGCPFTPDLNGCTKGIDNVHIDVRLSPHFVTQAKNLIVILLDQQIGRGRWGEKKPGPSRQAWEEFRLSYADMVEAAIHRTKLSGGPNLVQLVQFATLKFLIELVQAELESLRKDFRGIMPSGGSTTDTGRLHLMERLAWLARNRGRLRYKLCSQLFTQLSMVEAGPLSELRASLLGVGWPVPKDVLFNPLLQAESPTDDEVVLRHYVLLGLEADEVYSFSVIDKFLSHVFRRRQPDRTLENSIANAEVVLKRSPEEFDRCAERDHDRRRVESFKESQAWVDNPMNVDVLFNVWLYEKRVEQLKEESEPDASLMTRLKGQMRFQRRMLAMVEQWIHEAGLLPQIVAAYDLVPLYGRFSSALSAQQLHRFLSGDVDRGEVLLKIREDGAGGQALLAEVLTQAAKRVDRVSRRQQQEYLVRFLRDFLTYRRDLGYYHLVCQAMSQIRIQEEPGDIRLSRANRMLYEFLASDEEATIAQTIHNHVILKADVRGSTTIVSQLLSQSLNPASHFTLKFFDPLNELLEIYGAQKVFVEGDAVILSLYEYEETADDRVSIARACGLAKRLLNMVEMHNASSRKSGLPELELGIGLVFAEGPPAFLYDGDTQIMISSAIGKADRMSSCSWWLREKRKQKGQLFTNVEVYEIPQDGSLRGEKGEAYLRYNVNGIEMDDAGFTKLQKEISLQRLELIFPGESRPTTLYVGRYPDCKGGIHQVVVREGKQRLFGGDHPNFGEQGPNSFYEVVTNKFILNEVNEAIRATDPGESA